MNQVVRYMELCRFVPLRKDDAHIFAEPNQINDKPLNFVNY